MVNISIEGAEPSKTLW